MHHFRTQNMESLKFNLVSPKHSGPRMSPIKPREMEVPVIGRALLPAHKTVGISGQAMRRRQFLLNSFQIQGAEKILKICFLN